MNKNQILMAAFGLIIITMGLCCMKQQTSLIDRTYQVQDLPGLFPHNPAAIEKLIEQYMQQARQVVKTMHAIPAEERTFANTAKVLDELISISNVGLGNNLIGVMEEVHPDEAMRNAAHEATKKIHAFFIDEISNNEATYRAFKAYVEGNAKTELLIPEQHYFLNEMMRDFKRAGMELPAEKRAQISALEKEITDLSLQFSRNIAADQSTITVSREGLSGLADDFIASLKTADPAIASGGQGDEKFILGVDYPTYFRVMAECTCEDTRKRLSIAFNNRAYPINEPILHEIIKKRNEMAQILGFKSYADFDLDNQMVKTVDHAQEFLQDLNAKATKKMEQECAQWMKNLPPSVTLTADGKLKPWDLLFVQTAYKKNYYAIDEQALAEYFPMEKAIAGLFDIYRSFFSIDFKELPVSGLWHEDVTLIAVSDRATQKLLGYIFLDLFPRPNKFSHAAQWGLVPATFCNGKENPALVLVVANFPRAMADKPSLLKRDDVNTFFHEFGHALHSILGRTQLASQAGTNVKRDFVEMPSQMLEEWLWDPQILKKISGHYKTDEPLPDDIIDTIVKIKTIDAGYFVVRQIWLATISLNFYKADGDKDLFGMMKSLYMKILPYIAFNDMNHMYTSFGHLTGYGAKYYGYLWSKVFALDLFDQIKKEGLLNPVVGKRYVHEVIGRGGSADPNELLYNFLDRTPNNKAFLRDLGLNEVSAQNTAQHMDIVATGA